MPFWLTRNLYRSSCEFHLGWTRHTQVFHFDVDRGSGLRRSQGEAQRATILSPEHPLFLSCCHAAHHTSMCLDSSKWVLDNLFPALPCQAKSSCLPISSMPAPKQSCIRSVAHNLAAAWQLLHTAASTRLRKIQVLTGSDDGTAILWNLVTGRAMHCMLQASLDVHRCSSTPRMLQHLLRHGRKFSANPCRSRSLCHGSSPTSAVLLRLTAARDPPVSLFLATEEVSASLDSKLVLTIAHGELRATASAFASVHPLCQSAHR